MTSFGWQWRVRGTRLQRRCGEGWNLGCQSSNVVDWGLTIVLDAERQISRSCRACKTFFCSSIRVHPERFSAILSTILSFKRSLRTRLTSSLRAASEPGMPLADRASYYTRTPRNGVATPQYFVKSREVKSIILKYISIISKCSPYWQNLFAPSINFIETRQKHR